MDVAWTSTGSRRRRRSPLGLALGALAAVLSIGCGDDEQVNPRPLYPGQLVLWPRHDGRLDMAELDGPTVLRGGWAEALVEVDGQELTLSTGGNCAGQWTMTTEPPTEQPYFAGLRGWRWHCQAAGVELDWSVYQDTERYTLVAFLDVRNATAEEIQVLRVTPLITDGPDGGLFVGIDPLRHRILDNGSAVANDIDVKLHQAEESRFPMVEAFLPIESRGNVVSNWNHAIVDLDSQRSWVAGTLTVERAFPTLGTRYDPYDPAVVAEGRAGFQGFIADQQLAFVGKPLGVGKSLRSEVLYASPVAPDPFTALEGYADAVAAWLDFTVWTRRDGGRAVPNGWNSWTGSGSTGGLGTNIDETIMLECLEVMAREFEPFGIDYFQIDDGYQIADGDWFAREDRFPSGMEAMSQAILDEGLAPGLWISGFTVDLNSQLAADHPDWLADPEDNLLGGLLDPDEGDGVFDLSNDEVIGWIHDTMARYKDDWQIRWLKLDFAYQALPYRPRANPRLTSIEAYKQGIVAIREALGDDVFYLTVALMGLNYGVADAMRVSLDTGPRWDEEQPFAPFGEGGSFKSTVNLGARRYYLNNRVWVTHNDLLFFRSDASQPEPPVTVEEAVTLGSFIGLSGSIVKFGEDLRTLTPEQINIWRQLLPSYPAGARPMDLFTRHYPEQYRLPIEGTLGGSDAEWMVVGLLNWGRNYDYEPGFPEEMADEARSYRIDLADWGLDPHREYLASEFWSEDFLGVVTEALEHEVDAHGHAVIALRETKGHPQFLGHNRHITQGGTDLVDEHWDSGERSLRLRFVVDAGDAQAVPFPYRFRIYVPEGFALSEAEVGAGQITEDGPVLTVSLEPAKSEEITLRLWF